MHIGSELPQTLYTQLLLIMFSPFSKLLCLITVFMCFQVWLCWYGIMYLCIASNFYVLIFGNIIPVYVCQNIPFWNFILFICISWTGCYLWALRSHQVLQCFRFVILTLCVCEQTLKIWIFVKKTADGFAFIRQQLSMLYSGMVLRIVDLMPLLSFAAISSVDSVETT